MLILAVVSIPVLLCCKPCLLHFGKQDHEKRMTRISAEDEFEGVQLLERPTTSSAPLTTSEARPSDTSSAQFQPPSYRINPSDVQRPSGDSSSAFEQDEQDWRQNRATLDKFHNGTMQEDVSPAALEHAQKPKKLIKMMLAAARDDSADADHDEGFGIMMIH